MIKHLIFLVIPGFLTLSSCDQNSSAGQNHESSTIAIERAQEITALSFVALSTQLQSAMQRGGVAEAVPFCKLHAPDITDSLSQAHNCSIGRTSIRYRNPQNAPTERETAILNQFENELSPGNHPEPVLIHENEITYYYQPILAARLCLNCHGTVGQDIKEEDYQLISTLYPEDKAIGFAEGDLRGMWSLEFKEIEAEDH